MAAIYFDPEKASNLKSFFVQCNDGRLFAPATIGYGATAKVVSTPKFF
jgi:hypothetical protein